MSKLQRITALIVSLLTLALCLFAMGACAKKPADDNKGEDASASPTEQNAGDEEQLFRLAAAFRLFGEADVSQGIPLKDIERFVYCMYTASLDECELPGYGRIEGEKADKMLKEVFGVDPSGLLRTQYDPSKEQEFFYLNNYYYVRRTEEAGASYKVLSREDLIDAKENVRGVAVKVAVMENNELESEVCMELLFAGEGEWMKLQKSSIVLSK